MGATRTTQKSHVSGNNTFYSLKPHPTRSSVKIPLSTFRIENGLILAEFELTKHIKKLENRHRSGLNWFQILPFIFVGDTEHSLNNSGHLKAANDENERLRPVGGQDLAVLDGKIVQGVDHVNVGSGLFLEADKLAIIF